MAEDSDDPEDPMPACLWPETSISASNAGHRRVVRVLQGLSHGIGHNETVRCRGCLLASIVRRCAMQGLLLDRNMKEHSYAGAALGQRHGQQRRQRSSGSLGSQQPVREPAQQAGPRAGRPCLRGHCEWVSCRQHCACPPWGLCPDQVRVSIDGPTSMSRLTSCKAGVHLQEPQWGFCRCANGAPCRAHEDVRELL